MDQQILTIEAEKLKIAQAQVAEERQLVLPHLVGLEKLGYEEQLRRINLFRRLNLSPEMHNFLDVYFLSVKNQ